MFEKMLLLLETNREEQESNQCQFQARTVVAAFLVPILETKRIDFPQHSSFHPNFPSAAKYNHRPLAENRKERLQEEWEGQLVRVLANSRGRQMAVSAESLLEKVIDSWKVGD